MDAHFRIKEALKRVQLSEDGLLKATGLSHLSLRHALVQMERRGDIFRLNGRFVLTEAHLQTVK